MGKTTLPPEFIAYMSVLFYFQSPGGFADIGNGFWRFIIPALSAQFISMVIKIVQKTVGPTTWEKLEGHANKAMCVGNILEYIAIREMGMMMLSDFFWAKLIINCIWIGMIGLILVDRLILGVPKTDQVETGGLAVK